MEGNIELIKKVEKDFKNFCTKQPCIKCRYNNNPFKTFHCTTIFTLEWLAKYDYLKERHETETVVDNSSAPATLPAWCKVGQWVFHNDCLLGKIEGFTNVSEDRGTTPTIYIVVKSHDTHNKLPFARLPEQIQPVRFRPYKYEEAKALFGKEMEYDVGQSNKRKCCVMITHVIEDSTDVYINNFSHEHWSSRNAMIDGVPIGVPVIDEEAMKGGEQ